MTDYTSIILAGDLYFSAWGPLDTVIITGGGRKNKFLIKRIKKARNNKHKERKPIKLISTWFSSILSRFESRGMQNTSHRTAHLFATCKNKIN